MKKLIFFILPIAILLGTVFSQAFSPQGTLSDETSPAPTATAAAPTQASASVSPPNMPALQPTSASTRAATRRPTPSAAPLTGASARSTPVAVPTATAGSYLPFKLESLGIFSKYLGGLERAAQIYLPGEYAQNPAKSYKVIYVLDGQQLPEMGFEQTLNTLLSTQQIEPVIVVAVVSTEGDLRREELGAGPYINSFGWGTVSDAFNQFVVYELVPKINTTYHTLSGAKNTAIAGWSLGGLASFYLAWQYPDVFGTVGAFSPSFWWRTDSQPGKELQARVIPNLVSSGAKRPGLRVWFEVGTEEQPFADIDNNGVLDMIQDIEDVQALLLQKGYQAGTDLAYLKVEGGLHELSTWAEVMPDFLRFAFPI